MVALVASILHTYATGMNQGSAVERCPKCDGVGKPLAVRAQEGRVIVNYRCPYCETEWEKIRPEEKSA